jgi:uncharacterized protein YcbK (DUF882 family)
MIPILIKLHLLTAMMSTSVGMASPIPIPAAALASLAVAQGGMPVEVALYDENNRVAATVLINRDGSTDAATTKQLQHLFRDWRIDRERSIDRGTLAMLTDIAERYPGKPIEFVSVYRGTRGESWTSPHRAGRAIDFRIRGVNLRELRDYLWRTYSNVGVGWYPSEQFLHLDHRKDDMSWTFLHGKNYYNPGWASVARGPKGPRPSRQPGV